MRIAILVADAVPPVFGGAERLAVGLRDAIRNLSEHDAELVALPLRETTTTELLESYRGWREIDVSEFDLVISTKYPTWLVRHPRQVVYLMHLLRGLYDTYHLFGRPTMLDDASAVPPSLRSRLSQRPDPAQIDDVLSEALAVVRSGPEELREFPGPFVRAVVHYLDAAAMDPSRILKYAAISRTVAGREEYFPDGVRVAVAYPPASIGDELAATSTSEHFFAVSRLDGPKRFPLLIEGFKRSASSLPLKIAGTGPDRADLERLCSDDDRIELLGFVDDQRLVELYAGSRAVPFIPLDEDFGLITIEAARFSKPVITCQDSGGPAELVHPGRTGVITASTPGAIAAAFDAAASAPRAMAEMGRSAHRLLEGITWEAVVEALLGDDRTASVRRSRRGMRGTPGQRRKVTVLSTFPVHPRRGGGQLRSSHLYGALAEAFDVEILSLAGSPDQAGPYELAPGVHEVAVEKSRRHVAAEQEMAAEAGLPVDDVLAPELSPLTPEFERVVSESLASSACVVLAHPFLEPLAERWAPEVPIVYDAHNVELVLKEAVLEPSDVRADLLAKVADIERAACDRSRAITACSDKDGEALVQRFGVQRDKLTIIPNGSDVQGIPFITGDRRQRNRDVWMRAFEQVAPDAAPGCRNLVIFIGSWHLPNNEAGALIAEFAGALPEVLFALAGGHCLSVRSVRRPDNVVLLGEVDEATRAGLLAAADLALNPMLRGSGSNLKVGDYFAAGVPVLSTLVGVRGVGAEDGTHALVADAKEFPRRIAEALESPQLLLDLARNARDLAERQYDWRVLGQRMLDVVRAVALTPTVPKLPSALQPVSAAATNLAGRDVSRTVPRALQGR